MHELLIFPPGQLHWESPREDTSERTYTPSIQSYRQTPTSSPNPSVGEDGRTSSRLPFLPDLDPRGTPLSSQRLNNEGATEQRPSNRRTSMVTVRNSFSDMSVGSSLTLVSSNDLEATQSSSFNTPHPPNRGRSGTKRWCQHNICWHVNCLFISVSWCLILYLLEGQEKRALCF